MPTTRTPVIRPYSGRSPQSRHPTAASPTLSPVPGPVHLLVFIPHTPRVSSANRHRWQLIDNVRTEHATSERKGNLRPLFVRITPNGRVLSHLPGQEKCGVQVEAQAPALDAW